MLLVKRIKYILFLVLFVITFLVSRIPQLAESSINPDGVNWHYRSEQFVNGLKYHQWIKTYQHYHPGVTLMWLTGIPVEILKQIYPSERVYSQFNFLAFHFISKFSLVIAQLILTLMSFYFLQKIIGYWKSLIFVFILTFEPFYVGNSRLLHLDVLLSLFLFNGLLTFFLWLKTKLNFYIALSGVFMSLAFLTKSIGLGGLMFTITLTLFETIKYRKIKKGFVALIITISFFILTTLIFFPALWSRPSFVLKDIFAEGNRIGIRKGHGQIILGEYTREAGWYFYLLVILMKTSLFTIIGFFGFFILKIIDLQDNKFNLSVIIKSIFNYSHFLYFLFLFYGTYLLVMTIPTKKIDRYMITLFPFISLVSILGYFFVFDYLSDKFKAVILTVVTALFLGYFVYPNISFFPYYFTFTSPLFGQPSKANNIIAQKPFGMGIVRLKDVLLEKYGDYPKVGFYDTKPIKTIYPISQVYDIRVIDPGNYKILVLGINEELPIDFKLNYDFDKDYSLYINGLEYWKIYVKKD